MAEFWMNRSWRGWHGNILAVATARSAHGGILYRDWRNCDRLRYLPGSCVIVLEYEFLHPIWRIDLMICGYNQGRKETGAIDRGQAVGR